MSYVQGQTYPLQWRDIRNADDAASGVVSIYISVDGGDYELVQSSVTNLFDPDSETYNLLEITLTADHVGTGNKFKVENADTGDFDETDVFDVDAQVLTSAVISPNTATVAPSGTKQFTAVGYDQLGTAMQSQPTFAWSVDDGGTIDEDGLFTAGATPGGPYTVTAESGAVSDTATVTVAGGGAASFLSCMILYDHEIAG